MSKIMKLLSIVLSVLIVVQVLPLSTFAQEITETDTSVLEQEITEEAPAEIEYEVESQRTEYTKHFRLTDGTYIAATYNEPVHYEEDGVWQEIDNTLKLQEIDGESYYVNTASDEKFMLPRKLGENSIKIESASGHIITISPVDGNNNSILKTQLQSVENLQTTTALGSELEIADEKLAEMSLEKKTSGIRYADAFDGADLEYIVTPSRLKESIVITERANRYSYSFTADFGGLVPVPLGRAIGLYEKSNLTGDPIVLIEAPYMYDSAGEFSDDVTINITKSGNQYILTVIPDSLWINSSERELPVIVDPSFQLDVGKNETSDTYVDTSNPSGSSAVLNYDYYLYVGKNSLGKTRTYIKFDLPTLPDCSVVVNAVMGFQQLEYDSGGTAANYVYAYDCGDNEWESATINWNNQPMSTTDLSGYTVLDYFQYKGNSNNTCTVYEFDITKAAKNWYENGVNNGIMLASADETVTKRTRLASSDCGLGDEFLPAIYVTYVNNTGIEDYWTYQTVDLGRSGVAYVSDYNGTLTYIHSDANTSGNRMPVSVSHVYSNNQTYFGGTYGNMKFGKGFRPSMLEYVAYDNGGNNLGTSADPLYQMKYVDSDGTVHFFKNKTSKTADYTHEFNDNLVLKVKSNGFEMSDDSGNVKTFSTGGYLLSLTDANGNTMTVDYDSTGKKVTSLTDGVGKKITFAYNSSKYLTSVTDPAGRVTTYTYSGDYLSTITYPDGKTTTFTYSNEGGRLSKVCAYDTSTVDFTIKKVAGSIFKVSTVTSNSKLVDGARTVANKLTYKYNSGETVITDKFGNVNYISFDSAGRTVNVRDKEGNASFAQYNTSGNKNNTLKVSSDTFASVENIIKNNGAEISDSKWYQQTSGTSPAGSVAITTDQHHIGAKAFQVNHTSGTGRVNYAQVFNGIAGETYTLSAYIKIVSELTGRQGACIGFSYKTASGGWISVLSEYLSQPQDWHRESVTLTLPDDAPGDIRILLTIDNAIGTAYFDSVQLEEGNAMNRYNLLNNGGFEQVNSSNAPLYWTLSNAESGDGIVAGHQGSNGYKVKGSPAPLKDVYQDVTINGKAGDTLVFGGWAKGNSVGQDVDTARKNYFRVSVTVYYTDGTNGYANQAFDRDCSTLQYVCNNFKAAKDYTKVRFYFTYSKNVNSVVFDGGCLYVDNFGSSYSYNADGRLTSTADGTGQGISYSYDGPDLTKISQKFNGTEKESCTYSYDDNHNLLTETTKGGVITEYEYGTGNANTYGMPTKTTVKNEYGTWQSYSEMQYTSNYNFLTKVIDSRNGTTLYDYDENSGQLNSTTDPNGNVTTYTYDENTGALLNTSGSASSGTTVSNSYGYTDYALTSITHNGFSYGFTYDKFGRTLSSSVAGRTLITNAYNADGTLATSTYGNGTVKSYTYDSLDRITAESYNGVNTYAYDYNKQNMVYAVRDYETPDSGYIETKYDYDLANRIVGVSSTNGEKADYVYDERNNLKSMEMTVDGEVIADSSYTYKADGLVEASTLPLLNNSLITYTHDELNRTTGKTITALTEEILSSSYTYLANGTNQTGLVSKVQHTGENGNLGTFEYTYDANGNITTVTVDGVLQDAYTYDGLNQLIRHDDAKANKSYTYTYDIGGNILAKNEYAYTTGELGTAIETIPYTYDSQWKDLLTAYNGIPITYDEIGNPETYGDIELTWKKGRQLESLTIGDMSIQYRYNSNGQRTKKIIGDTTIEYFYSGNALVAQYDGTTWLKFIYSADGEMVGFTVDDDAYYYIKNLQGDVVKLADENGNIIATYTYDAWGYMVDTDYSQINLTENIRVADLNPIRYRGYYYDAEAGIYYLNSRYYLPDFGRFINVDRVVAGIGGDIRGYNLFSYCFNNPVNQDDSTGSWPKWLSGTLNVVSGALQIATGAALGATVGWTGFGAVVAGFLMMNGMATVAQGVGQVVNDVTKSNILREDNVMRTATQEIGGLVGGDKGREVAGVIYDVAEVGANIYAGRVLKCPSACFVAGTAILTGLGSKAIEKIEVGDLVWAKDIETDKIALKRVVQTFVRESKELIYVYVNGETITTTPEHPFYVPQKGWTTAIELRAGDVLVLLNGDYVIVEAVQHEILETPITVYNFEVENFHTYYVGENSILVHNVCGPSVSKTPTQIANDLGFQKTNYYSHGQSVYHNPKKGLYITRDIDSHSGGYWKMAKSIESLGSKTTRMGTYDEHLIRIGD